VENHKHVIFETKHPPYSVNLKRILILGTCLNLLFLIFFRWSWARTINLFILFALLDFFTFYLPAVTKKYIITKHSLIRKSWFGSKEIPFSQVGSITAAKGKILVVSTKGKVLLKIHEMFLDHTIREKFKDILFEQMQKH